MEREQTTCPAATTLLNVTAIRTAVIGKNRYAQYLDIVTPYALRIDNNIIIWLVCIHTYILQLIVVEIKIAVFVWTKFLSSTQSYLGQVKTLDKFG